MSLLDDEKRFYERFWALLNDPQLVRVFERYGVAAFRRSSVLEGFEAFVKTSGFSGRVCVEIGSLKGLTAIVLARYFEQVVTIDIVDDPKKYQIAEFLGVRNVTFVNVQDNAEKARVIGALAFDGAYVDGDHAQDTDSDFRLVERCGQVLFHEHWPAQPSVEKLCTMLGNTTAEGKFALWRAR